MRLRLVTVPDRLWSDRGIPQGAKLLWCYICALSHVRDVFSLKDLRTKVGISLPSLHRYLATLEKSGWLTCERTGLRTVRCGVHVRADGSHLILPSDVLFDLRLPRGACWTWGLIFRLGGKFDCQALRKATGYSQDTLAKHIKALVDGRWLVGGPRRERRRTTYSFRGANPHAVKRAQEVRELDRGLQVAGETPGYSKGQYILSRYFKVMCPGVRMIENAELPGLENIDTGGRMHCDIYFPVQEVAVEFHGSQHAGPTDLYPSVEEFHALRRRDLLKRGLANEMGIELISLWAHELSRERVHELFGHRLPFCCDLEDKWHLLNFLDRKAEAYRRAVGRQ